MTLAVKVALNPNTTNNHTLVLYQIIWGFDKHGKEALSNHSGEKEALSNHSGEKNPNIFALSHNIFDPVKDNLHHLRLISVVAC